jgi:hypothetical protein
MVQVFLPNIVRKWSSNWEAWSWHPHLRQVPGASALKAAGLLLATQEHVGSPLVFDSWLNGSTLMEVGVLLLAIATR